MAKMGRIQQPGTLKVCCLLNIAHNMDSLWCCDYVNNYLHQAHFVHVLGPFEEMPPPLVQNLLEMLTKHELLKRHHLHLLVNQNLRRLDLSALRPVSNNTAMARLVSRRCSNLTELNLKGCKQISAQALCEVAESFPSIVSLNLSGTKCTDQVLSILAHHCFELRELRVSNCPVTDLGVVSLCSTFPGDEQKCPKLILLDMDQTRVGLKGVKEALTSIPTLQWLSHPMTCIAIGQLHEWDKHERLATKNYYGLRNLELQVNGDVFDSGGYTWVHTACELCPHVTTVKMMCSAGRVVDALSALTELRSLQLVEEDEEGAHFETDVLGLLLVRGSNLTHLHLSDVTGVDLLVLGHACPSLTHLTLAYTNGEVTFLENSHASLTRCQLTSATRPFGKLEELGLIACRGSDMTPRMLLAVLACCDRLRSLTLTGLSAALTDELVADLLVMNPLVHLESLSISGCNGVTGDGLFPLVEQSNTLTQVKLCYCQEITRADYDEYLNFVKENRIPIVLTWS